MPEDKKITGIDQVDRDLVELLALGEDPSRLEAAKSVIADVEASMGKLESVVTIPIIKISLALNDPENAQALLDQTPESEHPTVKRAIDIVKTNLAGIENHPAVVRRMKEKIAELTQKSEKRDNLKNQIKVVRWDTLWEDDEDKLVPTAR
ncbi:MAG TPA: hypothetical protein ENH84_06215, partial [Phycisphaerae bacterium]|nr:hypothetical protein [Phycisphaerae bacterium]